MKSITTLLFVSIIFLASCGEDNITNNGGNPPANNDSLLFSKDSISVYLPTGGFGTQEIQWQKSDTGIYPIRITFTAEGYTGGQSSVRYIISEPLDEFCNSIQMDSTFQNNQVPFLYNYNYINYTACRMFTVSFKIFAGFGNNTYPCWIKLKNIKIYRSQN